MAQLDRDRLARLIEVGRGLMAELEPEALLRRILEVARELTGARYAALGILDETQTALERFLTLGIDEATHAAIGDLPRGRGVLGELIRHPEPRRLENVSHHPRSYGFPIGHPEMHTFLGVPILVRGQAWGNLYLTQKAGGEEFSAADEEALVVLADWAAIAIQNARLYRGVLERRDELERVVRTLEATDEIGRAVGGELELERILELIGKRGRALVEARALFIALLEGDELRIAAAAGQVPRDMLGSVTNVEDTVAGIALRTGRSQRLGIHASPLRAPWAKRLDARSGLIVPLRFRARSLGVIAAYDRYGDDLEFSTDDERLMEAFGASAATAVATGQHVVAEGLRQSLEASERERGHWARELHDETLQEMSALKLLLAGARRSDDVTSLHQALDQGVSQLAEGIERLRALITDLRPAALDQSVPVPRRRRWPTACGPRRDWRSHSTSTWTTSTTEPLCGTSQPSKRPSIARCRRRSPTSSSTPRPRASPSACARAMASWTSACATAGDSTPSRTRTASACSGCASASAWPAARSRFRRAPVREPTSGLGYPHDASSSRSTVQIARPQHNRPSDSETVRPRRAVACGSASTTVELIARQ